MAVHEEAVLVADHVQVVQEVGGWAQDQVHMAAQDQVAAQDRMEVQDHTAGIIGHRDHLDHQDIIITIITTMVEHTTVEEEVAADALAYWQ